MDNEMSQKDEEGTVRNGGAARKAGAVYKRKLLDQAVELLSYHRETTNITPSDK
jgi:hypothetical protein